MTNQQLRLMGEASRPLVITSLNPFGNIKWQAACLQSFLSSGHEVISLNTKEEANKLKNLGINTNIHQISQDDTGFALYGKSVPLIKNALEFALSTSPRNHYILTNSDIFYSGKRPCTTFLHSRASAYALARAEIPDTSFYSNRHWKAYRGGLDVLGFTRAALRSCVKYLSEHQNIAHRMAFGIPGWDYYMGAIVLNSLGGFFMDGSIFKHLIHQQTYTNSAALEPYIAAISSLGLSDSSETEQAAHQIATRINVECDRNKLFAKLLRSTFYTPSRIAELCPFNTAEPKHRSTHTNDELYQKSMLLANECYPRTDILRINRFIDTIQPNTSTYLPAVRSAFIDSDSFQIRMRQHIVISGLILSLIENQGRARFTDTYSKHNSHRNALDIITRIEPKVQQAYSLYELFYSELIEHNIYNANVAKVLLASLDDSRYRHVLDLQINLIQRNSING